MPTITKRFARIPLQGIPLFLALCLYGAPAEFDITEVGKPKDKVTVEVQAERVVFTIISSDGIGGFKAGLKSGQWPSDVSIIINCRGLENFGLETDRILAKGAVKSLTNSWCFFEFRNDKGKFDHEYGGGSLRIGVKEARQGVEIIFPRNLFSGTKRLSFGWIDAYRR